jgi:hypothetical protein
MNKDSRLLALLVSACALLVVPAASQAHHKPDHKGPKHGQPHSQHCKKPAKNVGFVVRGTLTSFTADVPGTPANEGSVSITVTGANRHARNSGELVDMDPATPGTQVKGGSYTVSGATDPFEVKLAGFEAGEVPAAGDPVKIVGKVARTKTKCAAPGTSLDDRYGDVNIRKVVIHDAD